MAVDPHHHGTPEPCCSGVNLSVVVRGVVYLLVAVLVAVRQLTGFEPDWDTWAVPTLVGVGVLLVLFGGIGLIMARRSADGRTSAGGGPSG